MNQLVDTPQLVIKRHSINGNGFFHCLICSTAPKNAESLYREDIPQSYTLDSLHELKSSLKNFIDSKWENFGENILEKINIIIDVHGYNVPLENLEENTYKPLAVKFKKDTEGKEFDDFVIFINFSWPSEKVFKSQLGDFFLAMPIILKLLLFGSLGILFGANLFSPFSPFVLGSLVISLALLRLTVYFRDRDRATNYGVFDTVELVRWLHVILQDMLNEKTSTSTQASEHLKSDAKFFGVANLSFISHSMGCIVTTQAIRILSDIFDQSAINRWKNLASDGPFGGTKIEDVLGWENNKEIHRIGNLFELKSQILVSPDIPIWAITSGRSNFLRSCLQRFKESYVFTNNADMVLRSLSTVANYFVFPSKSRIGGYRLGNLTLLVRPRSYGIINGSSLAALGIRDFTGNINLTDSPFCSRSDAVIRSFTVVDCTDYKDILVNNTNSLEGRRLSSITANNPVTNFLNYILTSISHMAGIGKIDSHGGYFRGQFCLDLLYSLALYGKDKLSSGDTINDDLKKHQMAWIQIAKASPDD